MTQYMITCPTTGDIGWIHDKEEAMNYAAKASIRGGTSIDVTFESDAGAHTVRTHPNGRIEKLFEPHPPEQPLSWETPEDAFASELIGGAS